MTEYQLKARQWLNRAFYADKKAAALEMLLRQRRERAEGVAANCGNNVGSRSRGTGNGTENALISITDAEEKLKQQITELDGIKNEIEEAIARLEDDDLETVLLHRYLLFHTVEETAELMNYSPRTVRNKQKIAIEKLCLVLPCFASFDVL